MVHKKFASLVFVTMMAIPSAHAATEPKPVSDLGAIEQQLFWHDNGTLEIAQRLSKLEEMIFGTTFKGAPNSRVVRIKAIIAAQRTESMLNELVARVQPGELTVANTVAARSDASSAGTGEHPVAVETSQAEDTIAAKPRQLGITDKILALEIAILAKDFRDDSLVTRIRRLENEVLPDLIVGSAEALDVRIGRIADQADDMRVANVLPVAHPHPFDPTKVTQSEAALAERKVKPRALVAENPEVKTLTEEILKNEQELASLYTGLSSERASRDVVPAHKGSGLRRVVLGTIKTLAGLSEFATY